MIVIFDLDHTVIDSSHRQLTFADGTLDLAHWLENSTREKIFADTLLPLAETMKWYFNKGATVVVCTARTATQHDFDFLDLHGLNYHHILYREPGDNRGDAVYKSDKLCGLADDLAWPENWRDAAIMFDDNVAVIRAMLEEGLWCIDAIKRNRRIAA